MKKVILRIIFILIFLAILVVSGLYGYNYYIEQNNSDVKEKFYKYFFQNNFKELLDSNLYSKILTRTQSQSYKMETEVEFSNTLIDNSIDLDKLTLNIETNFDEKNKRNDIKVNYANNELLALSVVKTPNYIGWKNDELLKYYIGYKRENGPKIFSKVDKEIGNLYNNYYSIKEKNTLIENKENVLLSNFTEHLKQYIKSTNFSYEGEAIIKQNGSNIDTEIYSLTLEKDEVINLLSIISEEIVNDEKIIKAIANEKTENIEENQKLESVVDLNDVVTKEAGNTIHSIRDDNSIVEESNNINYSNDKIDESEIIKSITDSAKELNEQYKNLEKYALLKNSIEILCSVTSGISISKSENEVKDDINKIFEKINEYVEKNIDSKEEIKLITYVSNEKTIKLTILLGKNAEIDIEYLSYQDGKIETKLTFVENDNEEYNGVSVNLSKSKTTTIENNIIEIGFIENSEIISKAVLKLNTEGSENSNKYDNSINFSYSDNSGKFLFNLNNSINFKRIDTEILTNENSVILDDLSDENFYVLLNKLNYRINSLYNEKLKQLNLITKNTSDTILQNNTEENNNIEDDVEKQRVKNVLIDVISEEMGIAENNGENYTIQNLKDLQIEGYEISVSVSSDLAIVKINNYKFKIDKDFNLSE